MALDTLEGFTVGITADRRWEQQADLLRRRGARIVHGPAIATRYLANSDSLQQATDTVGRGVDYTVVTTGIGVRAWFESAESGGGADALRSAVAGSDILCRGPKAAAALQVAGVLTLPARQAESLAELLDPSVLGTVGGKRIAFQHHGTTDERWVSALREAGAIVTEVPVYRWEGPDSESGALRLIRAACDGTLDAVTFTSAPAAANLIDMAERHDLAQSLLDAFNSGDVVVACVGPVCASGAREVGIERTVAPDVGRLGLLVRVLTDVLNQRRSQWTFSSGPVVLQGSALLVAGQRIDLPAGERRLMTVLAERPGTVVGRSALARRCRTTPRAVEASLGRLRRRLGPDLEALVQTVPSRGYRLRSP